MFGLSKKKRAYAEVVSQKIGCVMASQQDQVNVILDLMVDLTESDALISVLVGLGCLLLSPSLLLFQEHFNL